jgi:hypothetical protein
MRFNIVLTLLLTVVLGETVNALNLTKSYESERDVRQAQIIIIESKIKNLEINTWEKSLIKQVVSYDIEPVNSHELDEIVSRLKFKMKSTLLGNIKIPFDMKIKKFEKFYDGGIRIEFQDGKSFDLKKFDIRGKLFVPKNNPMEINGQFSNISVGELTNEVELSLMSSQLKATSLNKVKLDASFSKVAINKVVAIGIDATNTEFRIDQVQEIKSDSKFSKYYIEKVKDFYIESSTSDKFKIDYLTNLKCESSAFSNFNISNLKNSFITNSKNSDIIINGIESQFEGIEISNNFSTIMLNLSKVDEVVVNVKTMFSKFNAAKNITFQSGKNNDKIFYKSNINTKRKVNIKCTSCDINLK